jgi:DNA-binding transcriptional MerR regulator
MSTPHYLTIGDVARRFGCEPWQVRRLFERGLLPPAERLGAYRVVAASDLTAVEKALLTAGYLPGRQEAAHA